MVWISLTRSLIAAAYGEILPATKLRNLSWASLLLGAYLLLKCGISSVGISIKCTNHRSAKNGWHFFGHFPFSIFVVSSVWKVWNSLECRMVTEFATDRQAVGRCVV
jgi:hypothetical protein